MGATGSHDPIHSTFDFLDEVVGYDLVGFFERNSAILRVGFERTLQHLLEAK